MSEKINILVVDDKPANLLALESLLGKDEYRIVKAGSGKEALGCLLKEDFALALLDVQMPELDGFETAALIRGRDRSARTPIIFLTAVNTSETHVSRGYELGAVDYIFKPIVPEILRSKVQVFVDLFKKSRQLELQSLSLISSEEKYRHLFESVREAILLVSPDNGRFVDANAAAIKLFGYPVEELKRLTPSSLRVRAAGPDGSYARKKDGSTFPAEFVDGPFVAGGHKLQALVVRDRTHEQLSAEADRLRERDKMHRHFLSTVSHDLRTPLTAIKSFAETLRIGAVEDVRQRNRFLETIERHADRLTHLVDGLLSVAEVESGKLRPVPSPVELARAAAELTEGMAPLVHAKRVTVRIDVPMDLRVWADKKHLLQVLQNLLDNAIKYNKRGGTIEVAARKEGSFVRIVVRDTGIGIRKSELPLIFLKFQRVGDAASRRVVGSGLGLYIIKKIVNANGGRITAESRHRKGSAFHVSLPLATAELLRSWKPEQVLTNA
jgi:signal transduction histidine kinase